MTENKSIYYDYKFKDGSDVETVNPALGIAEISQAIVSLQESGNKSEVTTLLNFFAILVSRAQEEQVPFGSVVMSISGR
jgi:hypothetical protein